MLAPSGVFGKAEVILDIENGVSWVHSSLVLCRLTNQTFLVGEGNEGWCGEATLLVGNDLDVGTLIVGNCKIPQSVYNFPKAQLYATWVV